MSSDFSRPGGKSIMSEALFKAIRASFGSDQRRMFTNLVLYTSFGVVHGRIKRDDNVTSSDGRIENSSKTSAAAEILELDDAEVEHLSHHMPKANFPKFFVRVEDINGFAFEGPPQQFTVNI
ncbi:MAG: hypothetical protein K1Y36_22210 [Blastocatellia bacterium]|nr:hypothetical protein [Blastocatellia bacterium]